MLSSSSARLARSGARSIGRKRMAQRMIPAKMTKTVCHGNCDSRISARGAPTTCPADPAAVAIPSASERFSSLAARPTTARMTPNPVPAMPKPTRISSI